MRREKNIKRTQDVAALAWKEIKHLGDREVHVWRCSLVRCYAKESAGTCIHVFPGQMLPSKNITSLSFHPVVWHHLGTKSHQAVISLFFFLLREKERWWVSKPGWPRGQTQYMFALLHFWVGQINLCRRARDVEHAQVKKSVWSERPFKAAHKTFLQNFIFTQM